MSEHIYQFKADDAIRFSHEKGFSAKRRGDELNFVKCPYCGNETDAKNKFSINLTTGQFNCFRASCGAKGNMLTLAKDFDFDLGSDVRRYERDFDWKKAKTFGKIKLESKDPAIKYLEGRGISAETTKKYQVTTTDKPNILAFPFHDQDGELLFIKYRKTDFNKETDKNKEWCEAGDRVPILFGMMQCNLENKVLVITEGQIDSLSVAESGIENAVSVPTGARGFTWVSHCWNWIHNFKEIIVFGDHERGEITLLDEIYSRFSKLMMIKHVRSEDYKECKDANEILQKHGKTAVVNAVKNAIPVDHPLIMQLRSVKPSKYDETMGFKSCLPSLDRNIKMFFPTQLCILTGERGRGKSTLASQLAIEAVSQGRRALFYSGELTNANFKEWTYHQIAGKSRLIPHSLDEWNLSDSNAEQIAEWCRDRFMIYDSDTIMEEPIPIIEVIKTAITQYGCDAIFIDNLMTAVDDDLESDIYRLQTKFIKDLKLICKSYGVFILLVAHPKKRDRKSNFGNDDILGSSNVTNLADIILRFDVPDGEKDMAKRNLSIMKNRRNGKVDVKGFPIYYQESSRRLSESNTFDKDYLRSDEWHDAAESNTVPEWMFGDGHEGG